MRTLRVRCVSPDWLFVAVLYRSVLSIRSYYGYLCNCAIATVMGARAQTVERDAMNKSELRFMCSLLPLGSLEAHGCNTANPTRRTGTIGF